MHLKRQQATTRLPVPRKGTKFLVRSMSNPLESVSVAIAIRDVLSLARSIREVKKMIHDKALKLNGKNITDYKQPIYLFNILEADKKYILSLSLSNKFILKEYKDNFRLLKIVGKKIVRNGKIQINFHDGTNILSDKKMSVGDSVYLDFEGKIKEHISMKKGVKVFITSGKYVGHEAKVKEVDHRLVSLEINGKDVNLNEKQVILI